MEMKYQLLSSRKSHTNYILHSRNQLEVFPLSLHLLTIVIKKPPFKVEEEGWGEFDLGVTLHYVDKEGTKELSHDLNFQEARYESPHKLVSNTQDQCTYAVGV